MKILYLAQTFPPEPGATKRPARQAAQWVRAGHEVTVLTALPSYPLGRRLPSHRGRTFMRERIDGVQVLRVRSMAAANVGIARRALAFASFAAAATIVGSFVARPDLVIGSIPKPGTELAALALSRVHRCPLVLEVRDVLPHSLAEVGLLPRTTTFRALEALYGAVYRRAERLAVTELAAAELLMRLGVRREALLTWPHAWDATDLADDSDGHALRTRLGWEGCFIVAYAGSFSAHYRVMDMVAAAERLRKTLPSLRLLLVGTGATFDAVQRAAATVPNVHLTGGIEPGSMGPYLRAADLFLWPAVNADALGGTKIIEYLAVGRPVLALEGTPDAGATLAAIGAGEGVTATDGAALDEALCRWADAPQRRALAGRCARQHVQPRDRATVAAAALDDLHAVLSTCP
ncbi:MAG: glycosyltransferase family 4 protein [Deltaproteobacteria bacterium]|nr:glycosyltransferase family 4 protein [Deltaproteobacteria bacterium]